MMGQDAATVPLLGRDRFFELSSSAYFYTGAHAPALDRVTDKLAWAHRCQVVDLPVGSPYSRLRSAADTPSAG